MIKSKQKGEFKVAEWKYKDIMIEYNLNHPNKDDD